MTPRAVASGGATTVFCPAPASPAWAAQVVPAGCSAGSGRMSTGTRRQEVQGAGRLCIRGFGESAGFRGFGAWQPRSAHVHSQPGPFLFVICASYSSVMGRAAPRVRPGHPPSDRLGERTTGGGRIPLFPHTFDKAGRTRSGWGRGAVPWNDRDPRPPCKAMAILESRSCARQRLFAGTSGVSMGGAPGTATSAGADWSDRRAADRGPVQCAS